MSGIVITMRYKDAPAAIEWLCTVLGFEKQLVVPGDPGEITHAQLVFGNSMIMVGTLRPVEYSELVTVPSDINGKNTQSAYLIVADIEAHYAKAKTTKANIVQPLKDQDYGGKLYACTDPEGFLWNIGSYDPWK